MGITSKRLLELELVDRVIDEPLGGAHQNPDMMAANLASALTEELTAQRQLSIDELVLTRRDKWRQFGEFQEEESA